jgi:hypothetical protein
MAAARAVEAAGEEVFCFFVEALDANPQGPTRETARKSFMFSLQPASKMLRAGLV